MKKAIDADEAEEPWGIKVRLKEGRVLLNKKSRSVRSGSFCLVIVLGHLLAAVARRIV